MIIIPMAGASNRFRMAGYQRPKFMLPLNGSSLFNQAVSSFQRYFSSETFLFVYLDSDITSEFIRIELDSLGIDEASRFLVPLQTQTNGQAQTVAEGLRVLGELPKSPITVFNIDTIRKGFLHPDEFEINEVDGYLEVVEAEGDHWSFVEPAETPVKRYQVGRVAEKERISTLCSTGLYSFRSAEFFLSLYKQIEDLDPKSLQGGERYIAPLYNIAIQNGADIRYQKIPRAAVQFCGTPEEYEDLSAK